MNNQMTDFTFAGKCPGRGASEVTGADGVSAGAAPSKFCSAIKLANPSIPAPAPARHSHSRRLSMFATRPQGNNKEFFVMLIDL